jgi:hypothetical protein
MTKPRMVPCEAIGRSTYPPTLGDIDYCPNPKCRMPFVPTKKTTLPNGEVQFTIDYHQRRLNPVRPKRRRTPKRHTRDRPRNTGRP